MGDLFTLIGLMIMAVVIVVVTVTAIRDLIRREPVGATFKGWLVRVADALSIVP